MTEGNELPLLKVCSHFETLATKMLEESKTPSIPSSTSSHIENWPTIEQDRFKEDVKIFYAEVYTYMKSWTKWTEPLKMLQWTSLAKPLDTSEVLSSIEYLTKSGVTLDIDKIDLIEEIDLASRVMIDKWQTQDWQNNSNVDRWNQILVEFPRLDNLEKVISFAFALPGTNANCERLFSEVNYFWSEWKGRMKLFTLESIMKIRMNLTRNSDEMFKLLVTDENLRNTLGSKSKYEAAKNQGQLGASGENFQEFEDLPLDEEYWEELPGEDLPPQEFMDTQEDVFQLSGPTEEEKKNQLLAMLDKQLNHSG